MKRSLTLALTFCLALPAFADEPANVSARRCLPYVHYKAIIADKGGQEITLTPDQFNFLRGVFFTDPHTPNGLPFGDGAILARWPGDTRDFVVFRDGDNACDLMILTKMTVDTLSDLAEPKHSTPLGQAN